MKKDKDMSKKYILRILNEKDKSMQKVLWGWYKVSLNEDQRLFVQHHKNWMHRPLEDYAQQDFGFKLSPDLTDVK
jgi:hypothetical protein